MLDSAKMKSEDDNAARRQVSPGGVSEFMQLLVNHQAALFAFIHSLVPGDSSVEDLVQETNATLCEKAESYEPNTNFKAFAFSVARYKVLSHFRDQKRRAWLVADSELCDALLEAFIEDSATELGTQDRLRRCLLKLPPKQRQLLRERYELGETIRSISVRLKSSEGVLQQRFFRIRNALRRCIQNLQI